MASSTYHAYSNASDALTSWVDGPAGVGTAFIAANMNGYRGQLIQYLQNHVQGLNQAGSLAGQNHATADIYDYVGSGVDYSLLETTAWTNTTGGGTGPVNGEYTQYARNSMFANTFRTIIGSTGTLAARLTTFSGNTQSTPMGTLTNDLISIWTALKTATDVATNGALVARNGSTGNVNLVSLGIVPLVNANPSLNIVAPSGYTGSPINYTLNSVNKYVMDFLGNVTMAGSLTVNGSTILNGSVTLGTTLFSALISDYRMITNVTAGHISVSAGGAIVDSGGNQVGPLSLLDVNIAGTIAQPGSNTAEYLAVSIPAGWNGLAASLIAAIVTGTPSTTPSRPSMPSGNIPLGWLLWRGPTYSNPNPSGVFVSGDITDARFGGGGSGGGSGTVDSTVRAEPFMLYGAGNGSAGGAFDMSAVQSTAFMNSKNVKAAAGRASSYDVGANTISPDVLSRLQISGNTVTLLATPTQSSSNPGPFMLVVAGAGYTSNGTPTLTTSNTNHSSTGTRYVVANIDTVGGAVTLVTPMPSVPTLNNASQVILAAIPYDSVSDSLKPVYADYTQVIGVKSSQVYIQRDQITVPSGVFSTAVGVFTSPTGTSPLQVWVPPGYCAKIITEMEVALSSAGGTGRLDMWTTLTIGSFVGYFCHVYTTRCATGAGIDQLLTRTTSPISLSEGLNTFSVSGYTDAVTTSANITTFIVTVEFYKKGFP